MRKKTRININTSLKIYIKVFLSFILNNGKKNKKIFKENLQNFFNTKNIQLTSQGRVAALNIFKVLITEKKKEIIISPYTLTEVINAIIYAGGRPIYVDIDLKTGLPLKSDLDKKINENSAGLVLTHLYSNGENIIDFHKEYNNKIPIIEDVAINFGASINQDKPLGTIFDFGFYSFGTMKNLCTFHGGAIVAKNVVQLDKIKKNLSQNIDYPIIETLKLLIFCLLIDILYNKYVYNFFTYYILKLSIKKLDVLMYPGVYPKFPKKIPKSYQYKFQNNFAIAGIENLKTLKLQNIERLKNVKLYEKYLNKNLMINNFLYYDVNSFLEYPILLKKNNNKFLSKKLLEIGYDIRHTWYVSNIRYLSLNYKLKNFPNCEFLHEKVLSLPTHNKLQEKDIVKISELINRFEKI